MFLFYSEQSQIGNSSSENTNTESSSNDDEYSNEESCSNDDETSDRPSDSRENRAKDENLWNIIGDFDSKAECIAYMKKSGDFVARKKPIKQRVGDRTNWTCNTCKTKGSQCNARFFTLHNMPKENANTYRLFQLDKAHNHDELNNKKSPMTDEVKSVIRTAVDNDLTLKYIMPELRKIPHIKNNMPRKNQVKNYIKEYRKSFGDPQVSVEDMIAFCEANKNIPDDIDEAFVIDYQHSPLVNDDGEVNWFRYVVTTKRLLLNASSSNIIHSDATQKIVVQRYPLLVFGATDKTPDQKFHLIAIMISKTETAADFEFGFKSIRSAMLFNANMNFNPEYLMADAAAAIGNGFHSVFGDDREVLMCESHMKRAVDRRSFASQNNRTPLKSDLDKLKLSYNENVFRNGCQLFLEKWRPLELEVADYIDQYWFRQHEKWYYGAGVRTPTTNNALEGFNGVFKKFHTKRHIKNLAEFKFRLMEIVNVESSEYIGNDKTPYTNNVHISNNAMKNGLAYSEVKHILHRVEDGYQIGYLKRGDLNGTFDFTDVDTFFATVLRPFDVWAAEMFQFYKITMNRDPKMWADSKCTCPAFNKRYICKHIVCMAYHLKFISKPKRTLLTTNQPKGRPKNASKALVVD